MHKLSIAGPVLDLAPNSAEGRRGTNEAHPECRGA
jgi:hypothetical protein